MASEHVLVVVTAGSREVAARIAEAAVQGRLAGSAQISPLRTWYRWKGRMHEADEHEIKLLTRRERFDELAALVRRLHDYELPQIVAIPIVEGAATFLQWIDDTSDGEVD
ncbi:MAG: divalent-cation tolerance protein CutA [Nannocystaceae bacterium]